MAAGLVWMDGAFMAPEAAQVPLLDRGYLLGDSVFATARAYGGRIFRLAAHLATLEAAAAGLGIALAPSGAALGALVAEVLARSGLSEAALRLTLSRGVGPGGIATAACTAPRLSIWVRPYADASLVAGDAGIASATVATRRIPPACLDPAWKTGAYLPNILARRELERLGLVEGVMLSIAGAPVSGTVSNLFVVEGGRLRTPSLACGCRPGVMRAAVLELAARSGIAAGIGPLTQDDLAVASEVFFTNSLVEILPVASLDGRPLAGRSGPVTAALMQGLRALVTAETAC